MQNKNSKSFRVGDIITPTGDCHDWGKTCVFTRGKPYVVVFEGGKNHPVGLTNNQNTAHSIALDTWADEGVQWVHYRKYVLNQYFNV